MRVYYNEIDPYLCEWLSRLGDAGLIPKGTIDGRDIRDVKPADVAGYDQCHFFAGMGGWPYALQLAGCSESFRGWTGSCPCQPFSAAGQRQGFKDRRHLWPTWFRLIRKQMPPIVFGEQVARAPLWVDACAIDLESEGYAFGAVYLPACAVYAPHIRERIWFTAIHPDAGRARLSLPQRQEISGPWWRQQGRAAPELRWWPAEPDVGRVAHGVPNRVPVLRALGNAIVPQVAAQFVIAVMETVNGPEGLQRAVESA